MDLYLDGAANTGLDKVVLKAMKPYLSNKFYGNASATHDYGMKAALAVEESRESISKDLKINKSDIIFTSGATEGNNTAIKSIALAELGSGKLKKDQRRHIICSAFEHSSVMRACQALEPLGFKVTYVQPDNTGVFTHQSIMNQVTRSTLLVCMMAVNNETGTTVLPDMTATALQEKGIYTLVDCTQVMSYGGSIAVLGERFPFVDMMTFSSHKFYGPSGVGCLIVTNKECKERIKSFPMMSGTQESGMRGGTYNVAGIVGMATALHQIITHPLVQHFNKLYYHLIEQIKQKKLPITVNCASDHKNIISLDLSFVMSEDSAASTLAMYGVACSSGSACDADHDETSGDFNPSHVLSALGLCEHSIRNTVRISFTKYTTTKDIDKFIDILYNL